MQFDHRMYVHFNSIVLKLAQDFINLPIDTIEEAIENAMQMIGNYCGADRITIYLYDWDRHIMFLRNEWVRRPKYRIDHKYKVIPFTQITPRIFEEHAAGQTHTSSTYNNDPQNQLYFTDIKKTGAQVTTSIPLNAGGRLLGTCVLSKVEDKKEWDELTLSSIAIFCEMLSSVLQRIEQQNELAESNARMQLLLDSTNDGIAMLDTSGTVLDVNISFANRFGKTPAQMKGKFWMSEVPEDKYGNLYANRIGRLEKVAKSKKPVVFEDCRDGLVFYNRFYPVFKNGEVSAVALFSTDITDKMKAIEQAGKTAEFEARMQIQTDFFSNMSHEFKTPLSIILSQMELMKLFLHDTEKMNKYIKAAEQNAFRLIRLVENILDIIKMDAGYLHANLRYMDIVQLTREITDAARSYTLAKSIRLQFETKLLGYHMAVDIHKTQRILLNLLSNAIKFTEKGGRICVTLKGKPDSILIAVSDNGKGIPKEMLGSIFDRFVQLDHSLSRQNEGTGIGLSVAKSFAGLLGGRIWVTSRTGTGSTFFVELPVQELKDANKFPESRTLEEQVQIEFSDIYV